MSKMPSGAELMMLVGEKSREGDEEWGNLRTEGELRLPCDYPTAICCQLPYQTSWRANRGPPVYQAMPNRIGPNRFVNIRGIDSDSDIDSDDDVNRGAAARCIFRRICRKYLLDVTSPLVSGEMVRATHLSLNRGFQ